MNDVNLATPHQLEHIESTRRFFSSLNTSTTWAGRAYRRTLAHYFNLHVAKDHTVLEIGCGNGDLLGQLNGSHKTGIELSEPHAAAARRALPDADILVGSAEFSAPARSFDRIVISDTLNFIADVQDLLTRLNANASSQTRLLLNFHSHLWRPLLSVARRSGFVSGSPVSSWLSREDVVNLLDLAGWETIKVEPKILIPFPMLGLGTFINRWFSPLLTIFCLTNFLIARPRRITTATTKTATVIIPARNESGNIEAAVARTPEMGGGTEIIFVEGGSKDDTWDAIMRVMRNNPQRNIKAIQQTGKGKGNAVREGFAIATGDILMILDADLTMPPEDLPKFFDVVASNRAEFANGVRLVYPMEEKAMRFLNLCANKFFGIAFSWVLGQSIRDTLCGTKVLAKEDYLRIASNRSYFGDFDPFGDFDLLFGADKCNLRIVDIPVRYRQRTYGETNIQRWRHGLLLLRMLFYAARKLRFV